jgi:methanogenic corrinoid protein MtbC1
MATMFQRFTAVAGPPPLAPNLPAGTVVSSAGRAAFGRVFSLVRLVEGQIIPRLISRRPAKAKATLPAVISAADVEEIATLAADQEAHHLLDRVETMLSRGVSTDVLLVDLLAPAARRLGEQWEDDSRDFVEVTMGLWRLQEAVHEISRRDGCGSHGRHAARSALFSAMPGDQHSFGAVVVEEMFARDGWTTERLCEPSLSDLYQRLDESWFDVIGLTVSCDCHSGALPSVVKAIRSVSRNARVIVLVGGRVFAGDPDLAVRIGADGTAADARSAVALANRLVSDAVHGSRAAA